MHLFGLIGLYLQNEKIKQNELALLETVKKISASRLDFSILKPRILG